MAMVKGGAFILKSGKFCSSYSALQNHYSTTNSIKNFSMFSQMLTRFNKVKAKFIADSVLLMKNTVLQIDVITTNRLKQVNSLSGLYGHMYGSDRLKAVMAALAKSLRMKSRHLLLGATVFQFQGSIDWEEIRAKEAEIAKYSKEIDSCKALTQKTLMCQTCQKRLRIDKEVEGVQYCHCKSSPKSVYGIHSEHSDGWTPFLERKDILVWRKEHSTMKGMYFYKMYGKFDDVTADEFIQVQTDTSDFRLDWDNSTAKCAVVDKKNDSGQEVYYWETIWPRFFSNRYYCCSRQLVQNLGDGRTVLISRSTDHPRCKDNQSNKVVSVEGYESILTVQPTTTSDQMGIEFALSGFENPGVKLPESIITWVAIRGMPEFMLNLRQACLKYRAIKGEKEIETYPAHHVSKSTTTSESKDESYVGGSNRMYA
jgi:hypothetical protein